MKRTIPEPVIHGVNLSEAWAKAFMKCWSTPGGTIAPGIVCFDVDEDDEHWSIETPQIRKALDRQLDTIGINTGVQSSIDTVAGTIFPKSIWRMSRGNRQKFYENYEAIWPRVKKCPLNRCGVYFRRLTAFGTGKVNQLEFVLKAWENRIHRRSALQAAIFDPLQDHKATRQRGFPCLQQIAFHPNGTNGVDGLSVVAFYATQILMEKAYGNYLGLYRLGQFMAKEMGLRLTDVKCIASDLKRSGGTGKTECKPLFDSLREILADAD